MPGRYRWLVRPDNNTDRDSSDTPEPSLADKIEQVRRDEDFVRRAREVIARDKELLDRLARS